MENKTYSVDVVAEHFSKLVSHEHFEAAQFIEEALRDVWCRALFNLDIKSETFAVEASNLKGKINALDAIRREREHYITLHKENIRNSEEKEKKLSEESTKLKSKFLGPKGRDLGRVGIKGQFLKGMEERKK